MLSLVHYPSPYINDCTDDAGYVVSLNGSLPSCNGKALVPFHWRASGSKSQGKCSVARSAFVGIHHSGVIGNPFILGHSANGNELVCEIAGKN